MAIKTWVSAAQMRPETHKIQVTVGPAATDYVTATCNSKEVRVVFGAAGLTVAEAASKIGEMLTTGVPADDEYFLASGNQIGEFAGLTVTVNDDTVIVTGLEDRPHGIVFAKSGTITIVNTTVQSATGPHHADVGANWSPSGVPGDDDDIVYDRGNIDCKYAIDALGDVNSITRTNGYAGNIGLPQINKLNILAPFIEYLETHLAANETDPITVNIGTGSGTPTGFTKIAFSGNATVNVFDAPVANVTEFLAGSTTVKIVDELPFDFIGLTGGDVTVQNGRGHIAGTIGNLYMGSNGQNWVDCEASVTGDIVKQAGTLSYRSGTVTGVLFNNSGDTIIVSGTLTGIPVLRGGRLVANGTTAYPAINMYGASIVDFSQDARPKTCGTITRYSKAAKIVDPYSVVASMTTKLQGSDLTGLDVGGDGGTWTRSA
jgi:hypothetical protein